MKVLLFFCLFIAQYSIGQVVKLKPGTLKPGFISITRFDGSRPAVQEQVVKDKGRIIQVNIWYPSAGDTKRVHFADYVELVGKELDISPANSNPQQKGIDKYFEWPVSAGADKKKFITFLESKIPMQAHRDATWLKQTYPVVILVHGFAVDHAYLAEYLCSNGYVVMQVPVKGTFAYELDYEGQGLASQVKDYEFALEIIEKEYAVSLHNIAVAGFSFGGQSAVALALRNKNIKAIISLDGGIGSAFGAQLLSRQSYYNSQQITAPILHLYNAEDTYTDLTWFEHINRSNRFIAAMKNMQHGHFTSFGLLDKTLPGIMGKPLTDPGNGYEAVMLLTKEFLAQRFNKNIVNAGKFFDTQKTVYPWIKECIGNTGIKLSAG